MNSEFSLSPAQSTFLLQIYCTPRAVLWFAVSIIVIL